MAEKIRIVFAKNGVEELLKDKELLEGVQDSISGPLSTLFRNLYPGTRGEWRSRVVIGPQRGSIVLTNDDRALPFREMYAGRIRKALRRQL